MGRPPVGGGRQPHPWHPSELSALWLISDPPIGAHPCNLGLRHGSRQRQDLVEAGGDLREGFRPCVLVLKAPRPHPVPSLEVLALHRRAPSLVPLSRRAWGVGKVGGGETGVSWDCGTREGLSPAHVALALPLGRVRTPLLRGNKVTNLLQPVPPPRAEFTRLHLLLMML